MKKSIVAIVFFTFLANATLAQDNGKTFKNQLEVGVGYQNIYLKDANFSPLNQNGDGLLYSISYIRSLNNRFGISVHYGSGSLDSGPENRFSTSYINANLAVEYLVGLLPTTNSFNFYLGVSYNTRVLFLDWYDLDAFSYTATHGFSLKGLLTKSIGEKNIIQTSLAIPILQYLARPPYNGLNEFIIENQDNPATIILNGHLVSVNKYLGLEWLLSYRYQLSNRFDFKIENALRVQNVNESHHVKNLTNSISTAISFKF